MIIVDNAAYSFIFQLENGVPILTYKGGDDKELPKLEKYLVELKECRDVRELNKKVFKFHHYRNYEDPFELIR